MKLGYLLPTRENVMAGRPEAALLLDAGKAAADLGFDSLWAGDSLLARPRHDPLTLLAAAAAAIPNVDVGTAVLLPALRNPVVLAQQLATIDQISAGRLIVGVGIAADAPPIRAEFAAASVPFDKRVGRLVEGLQLCRALWAGAPVTWSGRWQVEGATLGPMPSRVGGPPIWLAASVPAGIERAAKYFDGWFPIGPNVEKFGDNQALYRSCVDTHQARAATTAIYLTLCLADDPSEGERVLNHIWKTTMACRLKSCAAYRRVTRDP